MFVSFLEEESSGAAKNRPASNQLTALLMETSSSTSTPVVGAVSAKDSVSSSLVPSAASNPLLITPQDARAMHASTFKTSLSHQQIKQYVSTSILGACLGLQIGLLVEIFNWGKIYEKTRPCCKPNAFKYKVECSE